MQAAFNYLFCRGQGDTSPAKDTYVQGAATIVEGAVGAGAMVYAVTSVKSFITKKNAQYCVIQALTTLAEVQKQMQLFNVSCIPVEPGSNLSMCNASLLPKPVNTSCPDIASAGFIDYIPTMILAAGMATFGLLMSRSILASCDQRHQLNAEEWYLFMPEASIHSLTLTSDESEILTEYSSLEMPGV